MKKKISSIMEIMEIIKVMEKNGGKLLKAEEFFTPYTGFLCFVCDSGITDLARNNLKIRGIRESQSC